MFSGVDEPPAVGGRLHVAVTVAFHANAPFHQAAREDFLVDPEEQLTDPILGVRWCCLEPELWCSAGGELDYQACRMPVSLPQLDVDVSRPNAKIIYLVVEVGQRWAS